jgi:hypothetical protein
VDKFTTAYSQAALWSSHDESNEAGGEPLDQNYGTEDIAEEALAEIVADCTAFQATEAWKAAIANEDPRTDRRTAYGCSIEESAGHDFWLTRNGHGAGFWDGDWKEPHGTALDRLAKLFLQINLYVGDDGKIYSM